MTIALPIGASSNQLLQNSWDAIPWKKADKVIKRLQMRIAKATREQKMGKVNTLQRLLTSSFYGKFLAVKRVVQSKGGKTPGVDGVTWQASKQRMQAVGALKRRGYTSQPLKRIYIPKKDGRKRSLSISTLYDRAQQALWKLALEPVAEERADLNAYGFRPMCSTVDAIQQCHIALSQKTSATWILEGDIEACFDRIDHDWLMENIPMDKTILGKFLKAWSLRKYFKSQGNRNWVFSDTVIHKGKMKTISLFAAHKVSIRRRIKVKGAAHPFDHEFKDYFELRKKSLNILWSGEKNSP